MTGKLLKWLDNRTGFRALLHEALYERIPGGARWRYVWGSTLVFTFILQMITGVFLWSAYSPSTQTAWESVYYIQEVMTFGSVVRGIHHYAAQAMVVLLAVHLIQVIIDGAYKAPREINFWLGLLLMQIVLGLALTGYLLPWDQKGYYATQVSTKIMGATPLVGPQLQELVQGGPEYGHHTLTRFFALHAGVLPGLLILFLALHIYVFRRHGITVPDEDREAETTFWPDQVLKDAVACLAVLAVVLLLAIFKGAELSAPADPSEAYGAARPEWYFLFLFRFLRFHQVEQFGLAFGAIYVPGILMTILALMPLIAHIKGGHKFNVLFTWAVSLGIIGLTCLAFYDDANDRAHQAALAEAHRDSVRVRELAKRPERIPVGGAVTLLRDDPLTQGPRLFAKHCAGCHRFNGHNGRGIVPQILTDDGKMIEALPTAADLGGFASRKWMRSVVTDYGQHFSSITNSAAHQRLAERRALFASLREAPAQNRAGLEELGVAIRTEQLDGRLAVATSKRDGLAQKLKDLEARQQQIASAFSDASDEMKTQIAGMTDGLRAELKQAEAELEDAREAVRGAENPAALKTEVFGDSDPSAVAEKVSELIDETSETLLNPAESDMADWSGDRDVLLSDENKANLDALIEFLVAEAGHRSVSTDAELVQQGRAVAIDGEWAGDLEACASCHESIGEVFVPRDTGGLPDLAKYGSREWLLSFIRDPGTDQHYGNRNQMPSYRDKMTDRELRLLVDWMTGRYFQSDLTPVSVDSSSE